MNPAEYEFFEKEIRPLLAGNCYACHSEQNGLSKGGLTLDGKAGWQTGGDSGPALVPGDPDASLVIEAVRYENPDLQMPPSGKLTDGEIAALEQWVRMGAPDPRRGAAAREGEKPSHLEAGDHWAFQPVRDLEPPAAENVDWPLNDIDRFILAGLERAGLEPAAGADKRTLIRRAYFVLTGLPPSPESIEAFIQDDSPDAYETLIDGLLASPRFGERWGRHWLDVARYADSSGGGRAILFRQAWRYRDYVIESFNRDKPYDEFVREQIAGDLLPYQSADERAERITATGFLALGPINYELQDKEMLDLEVIDEQLDTLGKSLMGMTIGCARCHDHKFDPIPAEDYYALAAIFKNTQTLEHANVSNLIHRPLPAGGDREAVYAEIEALEGQLSDTGDEIRELENLLKPSLDDLPGFAVDNKDAELEGAWTSSKSSPQWLGTDYLHDGNANKGSMRAVYKATLPGPGVYEARLSYSPGGNRASNAPVTVEYPGGSKRVYVNQREEPPIDGVFVSLGRFELVRGGEARIVVSNEGTDGHVIADAVHWFPAGGEDEGNGGLERIARRIRELRRDEIALLGERRDALERRKDELTERVEYPRPEAMAVRDAEQISDFYVCVRGDIHNRGKDVARGFLRAVDFGGAPPIPEDNSGRLALAEWIVHPSNPLTARVMVNRIWLHVFGEGLSRTPDNFGRMGEPPSHPQLLDWLAARFVEGGWRVKPLIKTMMMSGTFRMGGAANDEALAADPDNRLLWRMAPRCLDAEAVRDAMLAVSGQLDLTMGGPAFPAGLRSEFAYEYQGNRRSVYMPVFRNAMHGLFEVFDAADPNRVSGRRNATTLPTQALYFMNGPMVRELAERAGGRIAPLGAESPGGGIDHAFELALGRPPLDAERKAARRYLESSGTGNPRAGLMHSLFSCIDFRYLY